MSLDEVLAKRSDRTIAEDCAIGESSLDMPRCTTCGRVLRDQDWRASEARWACPGYTGDGMDEKLAAWLRLGPFAPKRQPAFKEAPMDGYVQTGPNSYERIGPGPDFRDVWQAGLRAVRNLRKRGEW